jgi:hypothetical protein
MRTREQLSNDVTALYRLAFLITAARDLSIGLAADALAFHHAPGPSFPDGITGSARVLVMAEALMAIGGELAASARRTQSSPAEPRQALPRARTLDQGTTWAELEQALLAIDVFPRCALLLTVYEGLSLDVAAILMDTNRELVRKAQILGLWELTCNLAKLQGWIPSVPAEAGSYAVTREVRDARPFPDLLQPVDI